MAAGWLAAQCLASLRSGGTAASTYEVWCPLLGRADLSVPVDESYEVRVQVSTRAIP